MSDIVDLLTAGVEQYKRVFYVANNPTFRTGIDINADPTALAATEGMFSVYNSASRTSGSNKNTLIVPIYLKLVVKTAAGSGTDFSMRIANDTQDRYSSGGTTLTGNETYADTLSGFSRRTSKATINFGDLTLAAASSEKQIGQVTWHSATTSGIAGNQFYLTWGNFQQNMGLVAAAAIQMNTQCVMPTVIGPGCTMIIQPFETSAATTEANFEVEFGYAEIKRGDAS